MWVLSVEVWRWWQTLLLAVPVTNPSFHYLFNLCHSPRKTPRFNTLFNLYLWNFCVRSLLFCLPSATLRPVLSLGIFYSLFTVSYQYIPTPNIYSQVLQPFQENHVDDFFLVKCNPVKRLFLERKLKPYKDLSGFFHEYLKLVCLYIQVKIQFIQIFPCFYKCTPCSHPARCKSSSYILHNMW